eukprot:5747740-Pleurochrysis_carterae.AAC.1
MILIRWRGDRSRVVASSPLMIGRYPELIAFGSLQTAMLATAVIATAAAAFAPATLHVTPGAVTAASHSRNAVQMIEGFNRRELLGAALAMVPASAAFAD